MTEEKRNRIIAAVTVNVILLIAVLVAVIIYQLIFIKIGERERDNLKTQIKSYEDQIDKDNKTYEYYTTYDGLVDLAYQYGFVFGD